jgi:hypothetical protein
MSQGYIQVPQNASPSPYAQQGYGYPPSSPGGYVPPQQAGGYSQYPAQGYANQPVPQVAAVPAPYFGGLQYVYVADPMTELGLSTGVLIRQEAQFLEQLTGCESPNRYYVFSQSPQAGMKLLFKCKEYSECCMRNCCPANNREFNMAIKHIATAANLDENFSTPFIDVRKPCKCTCFCLERPEMLVRFGNQGQTLGRIKQPFTCCDPVFSTYDSTGIVKYTIHGDCCQCGLLCKNNFCGKLSEVTFNIYKGNNIASVPCGSITKKVATAAELVTSADSYQINFPPDANPQDKMLLIVAGLMIDYQFFEETASSNDNNNRNRTYY